MLIDSFEHAEVDFAVRLLIDARNEAETVVQATEKSLRSADSGAVAQAELEAGERDQIEAALADLKQVLPTTEREAIQEKMKVLNEVTRHLAEILMNRSLTEALAGKNVDQL
jgi:molecular chaperone DnaK (HSP70)